MMTLMNNEVINMTTDTRYFNVPNADIRKLKDARKRSAKIMIILLDGYNDWNVMQTNTVFGVKEEFTKDLCLKIFKEQFDNGVSKASDITGNELRQIGKVISSFGEELGVMFVYQD
jgi:hypothetical protein